MAANQYGRAFFVNAAAMPFFFFYYLVHVVWYVFVADDMFFLLIMCVRLIFPVLVLVCYAAVITYNTALDYELQERIEPFRVGIEPVI